VPCNRSPRFCKAALNSSDFFLKIFAISSCNFSSADSFVSFISLVFSSFVSFICGSVACTAPNNSRVFSGPA
jgi:hypothetical protein